MSLAQFVASGAVANMLLPPDTRLDRYEIRSQIGAGGMGEVYLARDTKLDRKVALKILPSEFAAHPDRMRRFVLEARAASALNHPNIITIYEIGETDGIHFIAAEYIEGETLRERIERKSFSIDDCLEVSIQIVSALQAAHSVKVVHRDIKPENIMIRPDGLVKLLDFGIAKLIEKKAEVFDAEAATTIKAQTALGMIIGTAAYMSPEQAQGKEIDLRSDIFSFGVVLFEMLTRRQPFAGENAMDVIGKVLHEEAAPLGQLIIVPPDIERMVDKTLRKDRDERYQTAGDLLVELKEIKEELQFQGKLERSLPPNKQAEDPTQIIKSEIVEETPTPAPNNLSENPLPIIGREREIAEIKDLLRQTNVRLVTLTGVGGTGKTKLSQVVARELLNEFSDGVFFIELDFITNADLVASTIAQPLGVKEAGGKAILEILKDHLRDKRMLLVVDNFEQITAAAPQIAELLSAAARLKILITSRTLLHLSSEKEFVVPPLSVPTDVSQVSLDELLRYEAIKLFVERAGNAKPNFALTKENANSVAEICVRLDGLPLAIELAAARVKILSPQMILTKLENRLKLLTGGARDVPARQRTMRGAIEWSYDLLDEDEKRLFRRLSVFAGGLTFEAAEAVCANYGSDDENGEVLDLITSLVDKSLLVSKEQADGEMRFRMLETVREYALESLEKNNEAEAVRRHHADYFLSLGEAAEPQLLGEQAVEWLNRLEEEHDNLRDALRWSLENDAALAARLAAAIRVFWADHSHLTEARKWFKAAFERGGLTVPAAVRFKLLIGLAVAARSQGDYEAARKSYEEALAEGRAADDLRQIALSGRGLGLVAIQQGDFTAARKYIEEALAISRRLDDKHGISHSLNLLGDLARVEGDNMAARPLIEEAVTIARQLGNKEGVSVNLLNLGAVAYHAGDFGAARPYFTEGLETAQELGQKVHIAYSLDGFAALAAEREDAERGAQLAGAAEQLREQVGFKLEPAERRFRGVYIAKLRTKMDEAAFAKAYEQGRQLKLEEAVALCFEEERANINR